MLMYEDLTVIAVYPHLSLKCDTGMPFDTWLFLNSHQKK